MLIQYYHLSPRHGFALYFFWALSTHHQLTNSQPTASSRCLDFSCPFSHSPILHGWLKAIYLGAATLPQIGWNFFHSSTNKSTKISSFFFSGKLPNRLNHLCVFDSQAWPDSWLPDSPPWTRLWLPSHRHPHLSRVLHQEGSRHHHHCPWPHRKLWNFSTPFFFLFGRGYTRRGG